LRPDDENIDIETLKRDLRQYVNRSIKEQIYGSLDEALLDTYGTEGGRTSDDDGGDDTEPVEPPSSGPDIVVKFRNSNGVFTIPTSDKYFGEVLVAGDGTVTVNVEGRVFDETTGIERYKVRIQRIG